MAIIIAIEGVDGSGKSCTIDMLKHLGENLICSESMPSSFSILKSFMDTKADKVTKFLFYLSAIRQMISLTEKNENINRVIIFDRYIPSLFAYNHVFNGLTEKEFINYMKPFWDNVPKESLIFLLTCGQEQIKARLDKKPHKNSIESLLLQNISLVSSLEEALRRYYLLTSNLSDKTRFIEIDSSQSTPVEIANYIIQTIGEYK